VLAAEAEPAPYRAALEAQASARKWTLTELGDPSRLLLVQAEPVPARALVAHLRVEVVHELAHLAARTLRRAIVDQSPPRLWLARTYLAAAARMEPEAGPVRALEGEVGVALEQGDAAVAALRDALRREQPIPPRAALEVRALGLLGHELLARKDAELLSEARGFLQRAVSAEASEEDFEQRFNNRYNLACVHARLGDLEPALAALESSLAFAREHLSTIYPSAWRYARVEDPDLASLRSQPGFSALLERMKPSAPR
jgi:tetratricopeptide (TPR) repeat protein